MQELQVLPLLRKAGRKVWRVQATMTLALLCWFIAHFSWLPSSLTLASSPAKQAYAAPTKYDPSRDASRDLSLAIKVAKETKRNVLIDVGGEWCGWCHAMDSFYENNPELLALRDKSCVLVKVDVSENHPNTKFLSRFPQTEGYPHIFILNSSGKLLKSEGTHELEEGESYNLKRFTNFLEEFAPRK